MAGRIQRPFDVTHRDVWGIALPATLAFITEPLVGIVDITVIGRLGDAMLLGGLVLGALALDVVFSMVFFLRLSTAGLTAQSVGAADPGEGLIHLARAGVVSLALGTLLIVATGPIEAASLYLLAPAGTVAEPFSTYLQARMWSAPFVMLNFAFLGWFYGRAAARTGMALQILLNVLNAVLSIWFVYGFGWGVAGVAWGSVLAQVIVVAASAAIVLRHFGGIRPIMAASQWRAIVDRQAIARLFALSRDLTIRSAALMAVFAFFTAQTSRAGALELAANAVVLNFQMVTSFFLDGQAQAAEQLCGKAVGANWRPAFERTVRLAHLWGFAIAAGLFCFWIIAGPGLVDVMTTNADVRELARRYLPFAAATAFTGVMPFVMDGVMMGATLGAIIRNGMLASLGVFLVAAIGLQAVWGIQGLWVALHLFFVSRGVIYWLAVRGQLRRLFAEGLELRPA